MTLRPAHILRSTTRATLTTILMAVNIIAAVATIISAYGGITNPNVNIIPALMSMMLPVILICDLALMLLDFLVRRWRAALIVIASWIISAPQLLNYSPLNLFPHRLSPEEEKHSFTLLTYNVLNFWDFRGDVEGLQRNATIDYILEADADIVNLQEAQGIKENALWDITPEQIRELKARYPYRIENVGNQLTVLSKYPFRHRPLPALPELIGIKMALFTFDIMGDTVNLFDVHLESIGLDMADKELYNSVIKKLPESERALKDELTQVRHQLISKLGNAFRRRSVQAQALRQAMDSVDCKNVIVAGDFNDIQGCYAIRTIMGDDMHDAYRDCALGPCITYHGNRFYFRIDHVLYRGDLKAVDIYRAPVPSSDHYPLLTTFLLTK